MIRATGFHWDKKKAKFPKTKVLAIEDITFTIFI